MKSFMIDNKKPVNFLLDWAAIIALFLCTILFTAKLGSAFFSSANFINILRSMAITTIFAIAATMTMACDGFDIIKQAGLELRISKDIKISTDRGRIEFDILKLQGEAAPGMVPKVYLYDGVMCAFVMEDMINHTMMRTALMQHTVYPKFADQISSFLVDTLLSSTDLVMNHKQKKEMVKKFINPDLCEITEDLVYSEPYVDYNHRNNLFKPNEAFIQKEIYDDTDLRLEVAKLKFRFMNDAQALIHGDLHTGSIFINKEHLFVFDPEFAFYGPIGYDVGNVLANMFFAWCNGDAMIADKSKKEEFCKWTIESIRDIADMFIAKFKKAYAKKVTDIMAKTQGFLDYYLNSILEDTAGCTGLELIRRTVGMANVKDITSIPEENKRMRAERIIIVLAKDCIKNRARFKCGSDYVTAIEAAIKKIDREV